MGMSASSKGPGGNVPFVPPWVPALDPMPPESAEPPVAVSPAPPNSTGPPRELAAPGRFRVARIRLGAFGRTGSQSELEAGLGHYTRTGLGGARRATERMG